MDVSIGDQVRLVRQLSYLKTADQMPMLRPRLVTSDELGEVVGLRPLKLQRCASAGHVFANRPSQSC